MVRRRLRCDTEGVAGDGWLDHTKYADQEFFVPEPYGLTVEAMYNLTVRFRSHSPGCQLSPSYPDTKNSDAAT